MNRTIADLLMAAGCNLIIAAVVFLPAFIVCGRIELMVSGAALGDQTLVQMLTGSVALYLVLIPGVVVGATVHVLAIVFTRRWARRRARPILYILSSVLVPTAIISLNMPGSLFFTHFVISTLAATVVYGVAASVGQLRIVREVSNREHG